MANLIHYMLRVLFLLVALLAVGRGLAQEMTEWRFFTSLDGLRESWISSITVSPDGKIWINHGDVDEMSMYDGYRFHRFPSPSSSVRVIENKAGQIWSIYTRDGGGFQQFLDGKWNRYPLEGIVNDGDPVSVKHRMPFQSLQKNRILFLLPDRLLEFDAALNRIQTIQSAEQTALGRFIDMRLSFQDGIWITGAHGVAKYQDGVWTDILPPARFSVGGFRNPIELSSQELFVV
ncbi:hypothetical protein GF373_15315, partial [bacterium]|nr:hypothetical protein [bacterium]